MAAYMDDISVYVPYASLSVYAGYHLVHIDAACESRILQLAIRV